MSSKLPQLGEFYGKKDFRGNLMFASIDHIVRKRASQLDDLYSLLCVAYYFIIGTLPWIEYIEKLHQQFDQNSKYNFYQGGKYKKLRIRKREYFDQKLIETSETLGPLFKFITDLMKKYESTN